MQAEKQDNPQTKSALREFVETIAITLVIYVLVRFFLFETYRVVGHSMDPTLEDNQFLVVDKVSYRLHEPTRGDIIVFRDPNDDKRKLIKRVIGLPGEVVEIQDGQVLIDGQPLDESYIVDPGRYSEPPTEVPPGQYFVLGDNRNNSSDSHYWGTFPRQRIVGRARISYWPPRLWGVIPNQSYGDMP
jgi:signal peptidase I